MGTLLKTKNIINIFKSFVGQTTFQKFSGMLLDTIDPNLRRVTMVAPELRNYANCSKLSSISQENDQFSSLELSTNTTIILLSMQTFRKAKNEANGERCLWLVDSACRDTRTRVPFGSPPRYFVGAAHDLDGDSPAILFTLCKWEACVAIFSLT